MCDDEMSLEEYGRRYIELGGMDDGFAWALHPDLCNRSEIMERVIRQAHEMLYEYRGEVEPLRAEVERLGELLQRISEYATKTDPLCDRETLRLIINNECKRALNPPNSLIRRSP